MTSPISDSVELRQSIIAACRWMNAHGLNQSTSGNISVRIGDRMIITPSGIPYDQISPHMMVGMPLSDDPAPDLMPSSEWRFHQRLLASRPDMSVVVHAHPPYCTALAVQRRAIPACHYMIAAFGGNDVPLAGYALYGSDELADELARVMRERHACLMSNHGATVLGETIERALWRLEELETLARTYFLSSIGGQPTLLSDEQMAEVARGFAGYGPGRTEA